MFITLVITVVYVSNKRRNSFGDFWSGALQMDFNLYPTAQLQIILFEKKKIQIMVMASIILRICLFNSNLRFWN